MHPQNALYIIRHHKTCCGSDPVRGFGTLPGTLILCLDMPCFPYKFPRFFTVRFLLSVPCGSMRLTASHRTVGCTLLKNRNEPHRSFYYFRNRAEPHCTAGYITAPAEFTISENRTEPHRIMPSQPHRTVRIKVRCQKRLDRLFKGAVDLKPYKTRSFIGRGMVL